MSSISSAAPPRDRRVFADRRAGHDRRIRRRRARYLPVPRDAREAPDRRLGPERRSTVERRHGRRRNPLAGVETPSQHLRNGLQLLDDLTREGLLPADDRHSLGAAIDRIEAALRQIERREGRA